MSVLEVSHLSHSYGGREIFEDVSFRLLKGEHVALVGANGEGKSTFMAIITGKLTPDAGQVTWAKRTKVGYLDQHAALASCGLTNEHITTKMTALSGGEAAKVRLAKIMQKPVNLLVLDEPTNHLDVEAKKELKRALQEYKGTLLLVSHEPDFYEDLVDTVWNIESWSTKIV